METTATVNIEINGKPVRNELKSLRAEALRLAESFVEAENAMDFSKSNETLSKLLKIIDAIDEKKSSIALMFDDNLEIENNGIYNKLTALKDRILNIFSNDDIDETAKKIVTDFSVSFAEYLKGFELPKLTDDLGERTTNNDAELNGYLTELTNLVDSFKKYPNKIDQASIVKRFKELYQVIKTLIDESSQPDYFTTKFKTISAEFNALTRELRKRWKGDLKQIKENEFIAYFDKLNDILLSGNDDNVKRLDRYYATLGHLKELLKILESAGKQTSKDWHRLKLRVTETESKIASLSNYMSKKKQDEEDKKQKNISKAALLKSKSQSDQIAIDDFNDIYSRSYQDNRLLALKLQQIKIDYLRQLLDLEEDGSKEYFTLEKQLAKANREYQIMLYKQYDKELRAWLYIYSQQGAKERMDAELVVVDELHKQKKLKEEEVEEAKAAIRKKYRDELNSKTATKAPNQYFDDAKDDYYKQLKALENAREQGLIGQKDYESRKWQIVQNYHNKIMQLISGQGSEWATMVTNIVETWKSAFDNLGSTLPEKLKSIADITAATFAVMNSCLTSYTNYANACRDVELAKVERNYDAEIKAAGNNDKKKKKLEEKKQHDIARIKTKYNNKAMAIEIAQATAQTAIAAINAYASASKESFILGPIASAMALAAGALQIATIQKSHKAQAMGYYEGGFTARSSRNDRVAGIVHSNEFVANNKALSNPELTPLFRLLDIAQKNNTVGSLTADDVTTALIGKNGSRPLNILTNESSIDLIPTYIAGNTAVLENAINVIDELKELLSNGIESYMVMDGERGFERRWENYIKLKNNPKR